VRPRLPRRPVLVRTVAAILAIMLVAACSGGAPTPPPSFPPGSIVLTVQNLKFDTDELFLPADVTFSLVLVNKDADKHNIAIRTERGFDGELVFRHDPISASTVVLQAGPIPTGTYFFICELHPTMTGTVIVN
jgi:plastocyanin